MKTNNIKYITWIIIISTLSGCLDKQSEKTGHEGQLMPSFQLLMSDSTNLDTKHIAQGKSSVLFFFSPICPYCRAQMDGIIKHINEFDNVNFYVFTVFPFVEMKKFYTHYEIQKYPNIYMGLDSKSFFSNYFSVPGVPYTAIYDKNKQLKQAFVGQANYKKLIAVTKN